MSKIYKISLTVFAVLTISSSLFAQNNFFTDAGQNKSVATNGKRIITPEKFRTSTLNNEALKNFLWSLPSENSFLYNRSNAPILTLPMPDGSVARFHVWESSVQEPGLAARFPEIRTFAGQGIDDRYATIRFDYNPYFGFSAQILSEATGRVYIDAYARNDIRNYISYFQRDARRRSDFRCDVESPGFDENLAGRVNAGPCLGTTLRTYRLAVACTGEYSQAVAGGNAAATHAAIVTSTNRITGVYEVELAIRLVLVANNTAIEYTNGATDPFVNTINTALLNANQANTDAVIGSANYDIGHVFTSDDNGLAQLQAVCGSGKARGATGSPVLIGDGFDIDYVAHEMGHQFGGNHTFNSNTCASTGGSYEPGGGTTIMAYAGICAAAENIQPNSDPIFHAISFDEIGTYISTGGGAGCAVQTPTGNTLPVIAALTNNNLSIPISTPFTLTGSATDANGDALTYNWEGWDVGAAGTWPTAASSTSRPLFRTRVSKTTGSRTFPDIRVIVANYPGTGAPSAMDGLRGEVLPTVARTMKFRLTVRDNRAGGGGVVSAGSGCQDATVFTVTSVATPTPFQVTAPNGGESYAGGTTQTVTWDNAGTTAAPFNVANVKISLSTDGGLTYPTVLAASTPNDGSEPVTIPSTATTTARVKIEAIGNIFFDISNANFTITAPVAGFSFNSPGPIVSACPTPTTLTATLTATYSGGHTNPINLTVTSVTPSGTASVSPVQLTTTTTSTTVTLNNTNTLAPGNYTVAVTGTSAGAPTVTRNIVFTITPNAPTITTQPVSQTVCAPSPVTFTAAAPAATTFQWQISTDNGVTFTNIPSANSASYTIAATTTAMNGQQFHVIASTLCGSVTSNNAILTVVAPAVITTQPASLTICNGANTSFSVVASTTVGTLTYQWQFSTDNGATWTNIAGATTATYGQTNVNVTENGYRFRVVVTSGCGSLNSNAAILTVNAFPTIAFTPPSTICFSDSALTLVANPLGGTFSGTGVSGNTFVPGVAGIGVRTVTYSATNLGCTSTAARTIEVLECAQRHLRLDQYPAVFVYPVPNNGDFSIRMNTDLYTKLNIRIYNSLGSMIKSQVVSGIRYGSIIPIHLFNVPSGTYHVFLSNDEKGSVHRRGSSMVIYKP